MRFDKKFWIIAAMISIFAILASSLVAASFQDTMTSLKEKISSGTGTLKDWQGKYFTKQIIVNTLMIMGILYIVLMVLPQVFPDMGRSSFLSSYSQGNTNTIIFFTVIGMLSLIVSINAIGPSEYVWEKQWWTDGKLYLLGDKYCTLDMHQEEIDGLKNAEAKYYQKNDNGNIIIGNDGKPALAKENWIRSVTKGLPIIKSAQEKVNTYTKNIEALSKEQQDSRRYCYTAKSKLPSAQRPTTEYSTTEGEKIGWGILRGQRLFVLIGSLLIFFLLFKIIGTELDATVRWVLTIMFAANTAQSGMLKSEFLKMAYWTLLFLLFKTFTQKTGDDKTGQTMACGLSFGIVNTMAVTAFAEYNLGIPMFQSPNFVTNFLIGAGFGLVIGLIKNWDESFIKKAADRLSTPEWKKRFGKIKNGIKTGILTGIFKGGIVRVPLAKLKKFRADLNFWWSNFNGEMKELGRLANMRNALVKSGASPDKIEEVTWGKGKSKSKNIADKKEMFKTYVDKINQMITTDPKDKARRKALEKDIETIEEEMKRTTYKDVSPAPEAITNPTYDEPKVNPQGFKSIFGILRSQRINADLEDTKEKLMHK